MRESLSHHWRVSIVGQALDLRAEARQSRTGCLAEIAMLGAG